VVADPSAARRRARVVNLAQTGICSGSDSVNTFRTHPSTWHRHFRLRHNRIGRSSPITTSRVIATNPAVLRRGALPRKTHREHPVLTPAQVEKIAAAMKRDDDRTIVRLLAYGGLRIGEALALRRGNLDPVGRTLTIRESAGEVHGRLVVGPTKTYAVRTITLPASLSAELALRLADRPADPDTVIFANKHGTHRRYRIWMRDSWARAIRESDVAATPHDLRSTCASLLIDAGASVKDVQHHLGHSSVVTTMTIYAKVRPGRSEDLASKLDALLAES
jgi:integrase